MSGVELALAEMFEGVLERVLDRRLASLQVSVATAPAPERYLTVEDVIAMGVAKERKIRDWYRTGKLKKYGTSRGIRLKEADVHALMAREGLTNTPQASVDEQAERLLRKKRS